MRHWNQMSCNREIKVGLVFAIVVTLSSAIGAADAGFLTGAALQKLSIAEYLRTALLRSECSQFIGAGELAQLQAKRYQQATNDLESRLSPADRTEFRSLAQGADHRNRLAGYEMTYITDPIATAKRRGSQLAFTCGASYNEIAQIMQRAEIAYKDAVAGR